MGKLFADWLGDDRTERGTGSDRDGRSERGKQRSDAAEKEWVSRRIVYELHQTSVEGETWYERDDAR